MNPAPSTAASELTQALQLLRWLDDERRKDRIALAELQKRFDAQAELLVAMGRRIETLEERLTGTANSASRIDQVEANLQQLGTSQGKLIEDLFARQTGAAATASRIDQVEVNLQQLGQSQGRSIEELGARLTGTANTAARIDQVEASMQQTRAAQGRLIEELGARLNSVQAQLYRFDQIEANLAQTRAEANALLDKFEHQLRESLDQSMQTRALERERDLRALTELRMGLGPIPELQRRLESFVLEDRRLNDQFPPLRVALDKLSLAVEEQRPRMQYLEEWGERLTRQISDLKLIEDRIKTEHAAMLETLRRDGENVRQQLVQFSAELAEHRHEVDTTLAAIPPLAEVYERARRLLAHYEGLDDQLRTDQDRVVQLLTLHEQRQKEALAEYRSDYEKNWDQYLLNFELYRTQQREALDAIGARLDALEQEDLEHADRWHALREAWSEQAKRQLLELERTRAELQATIAGRKRRRGTP